MAWIRLTLHAAADLVRLQLTITDVVRVLSDFDTRESDSGDSGMYRTGLMLGERRIFVVFTTIGEELRVIAVREE